MTEEIKKENKKEFPGIKNLIPLNQQTKEKQREITSNGGIASGKAKREKRDLKNLLTNIFNSKAPEDLKEKLHEFFPDLKIETIEEMMNFSLIKKVLTKGDVKAYEALYDRLEGKPIQKNINENHNTELTKEEMDEMEKNFSVGENVTKNN